MRIPPLVGYCRHYPMSIRWEVTTGPARLGEPQSAGELQREERSEQEEPGAGVQQFEAALKQRSAIAYCTWDTRRPALAFGQVPAVSSDR